VNFAEEYILIPPTAHAHADAVLTYNKGSGLPWSLDNVKLKDLNPIRKQSEMEQDLPSKFSAIATRALYVDPLWISYNQNQLALILGCMSLDFQSSYEFPFLEKTEGGCGSGPPFMNYDTLFSNTLLL
jgi:hypothetical protein